MKPKDYETMKQFLQVVLSNLDDYETEKKMDHSLTDGIQCYIDKKRTETKNKLSNLK